MSIFGAVTSGGGAAASTAGGAAASHQGGSALGVLLKATGSEIPAPCKHPGFALGAAGGELADTDSPSRAEKSLGILTSKVRYSMLGADRVQRALFIQSGKCCTITKWLTSTYDLPNRTSILISSSRPQAADIDCRWGRRGMTAFVDICIRVMCCCCFSCHSITLELIFFTAVASQLCLGKVIDSKLL